MNSQELEHWQREEGSATDAQNCFTEALQVRAELAARQRAIIDLALVCGLFVLTRSEEHHCRATDAVTGFIDYFVSAHETRTAAIEAMHARVWMNPDDWLKILPAENFETLATVNSDEIPF
jgi:hypothetical protein